MKSDSDGVPEDGGGRPARDEQDDVTEVRGGGSADRASGDPDGDRVQDAADDAADDPALTGLGRLAREELEPATVGARVPAGSARAAARASAARAGVTQRKGHATPTRNQGPARGNIFARILRYLREVVAEMRKVIWPTRKEMITYSIVVILFLVFMVALVWGLDIGFARAVLAIFG